MTQEKELKKVEYLTRDSVNEMRRDFKASIIKNIAKSISKDMPESKIHLLEKYMIVRKIKGVSLAEEDLKQIANETEEGIKKQINYFAKSPFYQNQRNRIKEAGNERYKNHDRGLFGTQYRRLYFPLTPENKEISETGKEIEEYLSKRGFFITDYNKGYATDITGKQTYKIGKILKSDIENIELYQSFIKDTSRSLGKQLLVLSDYVNDIAYMSTRRGWQSCTSHNGIYASKPQHDIQYGTLVAYLISAKDPYIYNPLARILLKPYHSKSGEIYYHANKSYGLYSEEFIKKATKLADEISSTENGLFVMPEWVYRDDAPPIKYRKLKDVITEDFLTALNVKYKKNIWGDLVVKGDLNLGNLSLTELPDLTNVIVKGDFWCNHNKLKTLKGSPRIVYGEFSCRHNELTTLEGMSQIVKGHIDCSSNKLKNLKYAPEVTRGSFLCAHNELESLEGSPRIVKGYFDCDGNGLTTLKGAPYIVHGVFSCMDNKLTSLEHIAESVKGFIHAENNSLVSLDYLPLDFSYLYSDLGHYPNHKSVPENRLNCNREIEGIGHKIVRKIGYGLGV